MPYIGQRPSKGDENNFKILDDISSYTLTFDGSDSSVVSAANDTITSLTHRFVQGQRVTYHNGGGSDIGGLSGTSYFIIKEDHNTIKLASSASNASNGVAVNITGVGGGSSHTLNLAFDGTNTKFKATHTNGQKAKITRAAQLVISMNGVIQQPHDTATPSTGFGFDLDGTIVFSQAPVSTDVFWAHVLTNNNVTFDISDNDIDNFTGNGSTVSFNLSKSPPDNRNVLVTLDGVVQYPNDPDGTARSYNVVENVLTFTSAPASGVEIQVRHIGFAGSTSGGGSGGVTSFYGRTGAVVLKSTDNIVANNATFSGDLTVNGTTTTLDTQLVEVDKIEVETAGTNVAIAVTHNGTGDLIRLYDGTTQKVTVDDEGKVGLGTDAPATNLHINAAVPNIRFTDSDTGQYSDILQSGHSLYLSGDRGASGSGGIIFRTQGTDEKVRITSAGAVGINTTVDAATKLQVQTDATSTTVGGNIVARFQSNGSGRDATIQLSDNVAHSATISMLSSALVFKQSGTETFRIDSDGQIGIGNIAPDTWSTGHGLTIGTSQATLWGVGDQINLSGNAYFNSGWKAAATKAGASQIQQALGDIDFRVTGSINADAAITWIDALRITKTGKVGIGTLSPDHNLHVYKENGDSVITIESTGNGNHSALEFFRTSSGGNGKGAGSIYVTGDTSTSEAKMQFGVAHNISHGSLPRMTIMGNGEVGIGTDDAGSILDVRENKDGTETKIRLFNTDRGNTTTQTAALYLSPDIRATALSGLRVIKENADMSSNAGRDVSLTLNTLQNNSQNEVVRITSTGRVGIGTDNPADILHLQSTAPIIKVDATNNQSGLRIDVLGQTGGSNNQLFRVLRDSITKFQINDDGDVVITGDDNSELKLKAGTTTGNGIIAFLNSSGTTKGNIFYDTDDNFMVFKTNGTASSNERIRIASNGRVGINTDNPQTTLYSMNEIAAGDGNRQFIGMEAKTVDGTPVGEIRTTYYSGASGAYPHMRFVTSDTERLRIGTDGKIGIQTTTGSGLINTRHGGTNQQVLHIRADLGSSNGRSLNLYTPDTDNSTAPFRFQTGNGYLFQCDSENVFTISHDRKVGINSAAPTSTLFVREPTNDNASITLYRASTSVDIGSISWQTDSGTQAMINYRGTTPAGMQFYTGGVGSSNLNMIIDTSGNVVVGGTSLGQAGSFGMEPNGHVRSILASGNAGDTLLGAISGVSNGFQISIDSSNNQTYKFHNGSLDNLTLNSSGELIGTNSYRYVYPGNYAAASNKARFMAPVNYASGVYWPGDNGSAIATLGSANDTNTGGNFGSNGAASENNLGYADHPGLVPCSAVWRAQNNDSSSNGDGGWNKNITGLPGDDWGYLSTIMVRRVGSDTNGQFYHGCSGSHTLYQNGNTQTNPYFHSYFISTLPQDIWCLSIGVITGNGAGDNGDAGANTMVGTYRLDTGQKLNNGDWFRMKDGSTTQTHRVYLYYSTSSSAHLQFRQPGFYVMDGSEPSIAELSHGRLCFKAGTGIVPVEDA